MTRFMLLTGAAALAIASAATAGAQGQGKGNNKSSAKAERSQNQAKAGKAYGRGEVRVGRAPDGRAVVRVSQNGNGRANAKAWARARGGDRKVVRVDRDNRRFARDERRVDRDNRRFARGGDRKVVRVDRDNRRFARDERRVDRDNRRFARYERRFDRDNRRFARDERRFDRDERRVQGNGGRFDGNNRGGAWANYTANGWCPPGLRDKMGAGTCMPPGQAKKLEGQSLRVLRSRLGDRVNLRELPLSLRTLYRDNDDYYYRYGNGYAYKIDRDTQLIRALLPLFGLGTAVGQPFPTAYANSYLPAALQSFYPNSPNASYRYANGYVYQVDPITGLVQDVDPMLGYGYGYGQMMPASYSAYNVPYGYRSLYQDNNDYLYRYAPGSIYRIDAGTGLIDSIAALLVPRGLSVGQPLPVGYDAYNVPYQYRSQYYDTPQNMYRYANGNIYQVDPTTRLVTAIISALI